MAQVSVATQIAGKAAFRIVLKLPMSHELRSHKRKARRLTGTVIILHLDLQCQFPSGWYPLRKCTGVEDCAVLPCRTSRTNQEDDILAALHARFEAGKVFFAIHRLLVNFQNDIAATEIDILGK